MQRKGGMRRVILTGLALCAGTAAAVASEVSACNAARGQASIRACGSILAQGGDSERIGVAHFKRGLAFSRAGDHRRALKDFEAAARLMPDDADARQNVAATKLRLGDGAGGREELRRQARSGPNAERAGRTSRVLDALDDYDAQLARRQRELEAEMRAYDRKAKSGR